MDIVRGDGSLLNEIDLAPANEYQEVLQNVAVILDTVQGSCPMFRDFGLPGSLYGRPQNVVENMLVGYLYDQIEEFEPRAVVEDIGFEHDAATGRTVPLIYLKEVDTDNE
jgi:phage baseplate assembly protein W